ncbi:MAG: uracil-DNA glycosylase family protein [Magnetovibrio sp.]|nr:uracil-DNA glycosylase family protein [Magnetovibrio sp.]
MTKLEALLKNVRDCTLCVEHLPLGANPIVRAHESSKILIIGQAPGTKVHNSGVPWNDASGDRLRDWLRVDRDTFYDPRNFAIVPMGFCYPGQAKGGGDNPPSSQCAPKWHDQILKNIANIELTLLVGMYAQKYYLGARTKRTLSETVRDFEVFIPNIIPLPHPSWRNTGWIKKNPWFRERNLPYLRDRVEQIL